MANYKINHGLYFIIIISRHSQYRFTQENTK